MSIFCPIADISFSFCFCWFCCLYHHSCFYSLKTKVPTLLLELSLSHLLMHIQHGQAILCPTQTNPICIKLCHLKITASLMRSALPFVLVVVTATPKNIWFAMTAHHWWGKLNSFRSLAFRTRRFHCFVPFFPCTFFQTPFI